MKETVIFNGVTYRLMGTGKYYLSQSTSNEGRRHAKGLHVAVWEFYSGQKVPPGYEIHHKDGNPLNNDFSNLECLPRLEHRKLTKQKDPEKQKAHLERIRELTKEWHRSEEGHRWHVQHGKDVFANREPTELVCQFCGKPFLAINNYAKFCSHNCSVKSDYREKAVEEDRVCVICGKPFTTKVGAGHDGAITCSRECRALLRGARQREKSGNHSIGSTVHATCPQCGKEFDYIATANNYTRHDVCCSRSCAAKRWRAAKREGLQSNS